MTVDAVTAELERVTDEALARSDPATIVPLIEQFWQRHREQQDDPSLSPAMKAVAAARRDAEYRSYMEADDPLAALSVALGSDYEGADDDLAAAWVEQNVKPDYVAEPPTGNEIELDDGSIFPGIEAEPVEIIPGVQVQMTPELATSILGKLSRWPSQQGLREDAVWFDQSGQPMSAEEAMTFLAAVPDRFEGDGGVGGEGDGDDGSLIGGLPPMHAESDE